MRTRARVAVGLVAGVISLVAPLERTSAQQGAEDGVRSNLIATKLREATDASPVTSRLEATRWLFEHEPERLLAELRAAPDRVILLTGTDEHAPAPGEAPRPRCIAPGLRGLNGAVDAAWDAACLERESVARSTGELMASLVERFEGPVIGSLARTLGLSERAGIRRAAFTWLVTNAGLSADYDWRALTLEEERLRARSKFRGLPDDHPAVIRDRWLATWADDVEGALTADGARRALIALIESERNHPPLTSSLPALKRGDERRDGRFVVVGVRFKCDLEAKTFSVSYINPPVLFALSGVFEPEPTRGYWRARITSETRACR